MITYQSHNNRNDPPDSTPGGPVTKTHEYLDTITLGVLINNYCYGKSLVRITRDFFFVDLPKKLNSLNLKISSGKLCICITIHNATKSRIICLTKTEGLLPSNSQFLIKKDHNKRFRGQTINKTVTNQNHTEPNRYLKPGLFLFTFVLGKCSCHMQNWVFFV